MGRHPTSPIPAHIDAALKEAAIIAGATILHSHFHHFSPNGGVSGVLVLAESHISIHTWPERDFAALDIFMCGACDPHLAIPVLKRAFHARARGPGRAAARPRLLNAIGVTSCGPGGPSGPAFALRRCMMATDSWVNETLYAAWGQRFLVKRELARVQSEFQDIMIFESHTHGRVMLLDGVVQITEAR